MKISIATVFNELYEPFLNTSLVKRAQERDLVSISTLNFFDCVESRKRIDAPTFGPGSGMLIKPAVVECAVETLEKEHGPAFKIFFSPQGKKLTQPFLKEIARKATEKGHLMLLPARYEGMDARVEKEYADEIVSVGDFVLMGGDIPAMMFLEGMLRFIPGVVGKEESVLEDSFTGPFVDYPEFTEPVEWHGMEVPEVIRSGNHKAIDEWRYNEAAKNSVLHHFSWLKSYAMTSDQKHKAARFIPPHYVVLMHGDVLVGPDKMPGTTSLMSIDIHDIARSSSTYGVKEFFISTPLKDQQAVAHHFLSFWQKGSGIEYNKQRHSALNRVRVSSSLDEVVEAITQKEGEAPLLLATSARHVGGQKEISYFDQERVWQEQKPVLIVLGTGSGLAPHVIDRCDYMLGPIHGFTDFNHLSVRSATAAILDRWLGINERYGKTLSVD